MNHKNLTKYIHILHIVIYMVQLSDYRSTPHKCTESYRCQTYINTWKVDSRRIQIPHQAATIEARELGSLYVSLYLGQVHLADFLDLLFYFVLTLATFWHAQVGLNLVTKKEQVQLFIKKKEQVQFYQKRNCRYLPKKKRNCRFRTLN